MAKWDGKQDLNNNDDEGPMPNNRANGLRTAIKTHGTLFVHQRKGKLSFTAPSVPLTLHVLTKAKVMFVVMLEPKTTLN